MFMPAYLLEHQRYMSVFGVAAILLTAYLFSSSRKHVDYRLILGGLGMQFTIAFLTLKTEIGHFVIQKLADGFSMLYTFSDAGAQFLFGGLANPAGPWGMVFAVKVVSMIIFFGALMSLLFHLRIVQVLVVGISWLVRPILGTSGAETLCAAANSMLGQTEAPLLIKHYLKNMTRSEMLVVMVSGFATLSGSLLALYGSLGIPMVHLLTASVMAIPSSIMIAKILIPETEKPATAAGNSVDMKPESSNMFDAISQGTSDGLHLAANVAAMLIAFISLIALVNYLMVSIVGFSLDAVLGRAFCYVAALMSISPADCQGAGMLLGKKLVINEFVAFSDFVSMDLTVRSKHILTYALAGFANFSCIGIQIGGIGALAPEKRMQLTQLGLIGLLGGTLANFLNACVAGLLL